MGTSFECGDFWDRLGGQALVMIGWCVTNHTFERWKEKGNQNFDHSNTLSVLLPYKWIPLLILP